MLGNQSSGFGFPAHPDKSSVIRSFPDQGIIVKRKHDRDPQKTAEEFFKLRIWSELLAAYNEGTPSELHIGSPTPLRLDVVAGEIGMTTCLGVTSLSALAKNYPEEADYLDLGAVRRGLSRRVGRLIRIKEAESLLHGDFQQRHLIFDPVMAERGPRLSVIDVESSRVLDGSSGELFTEHSALWEKILSSLAEGKKKEAMRVSFMEGYNEPLPYSSPIVSDIVSDLRAED